MLPAYFTLISIPLGLLGSVIYIRAMYRGIVVPNRVSFFLWFLAPMIGSVIAYQEGVGFLVIPIFMAGFSPFLILIFSFIVKQGVWKLKIFDYYCGVFSLIALVLWLLLNAPIGAFIFSIVADLFASMPTIRKAWKNPETESPFLYILSSFGNIVALLTVRSWVVTAYGFPLYLMLTNSAIVFGVYRKKLFAKKLIVS